ncbi:MAG: hypothetical protein IKP95_00435 [Ruminococcus sp.]|nr:hypothetical protein [Ruminococcus sp.]
MKESEFYKKVLERSFEPDFDDLSARIIASAGEPAEPPAKKVRLRTGFIVAACFAAMLAIGVVIGLNAVRVLPDTGDDSLPDKAYDITASSADSSSADSSKPVSDSSSQETTVVPDGKMFIVYHGVHYLYYANQEHIYLNESDDYIPIPDGYDFLGLITSLITDPWATSKIAPRLSTNIPGVLKGSAVFYNEEKDAFCVWIQTASSWGDLKFLSSTPVEEADFAVRYEPTYGVEATDTGHSIYEADLDVKEKNAIRYAVYDGIRTTVKQINQDGTLLLTLDRSTLKDPGDKRFPDEMTFMFTGSTEEEAAGYNEYTLYKPEQVNVGDVLWIQVTAYFDSSNIYLIKDSEGTFSRIETRYLLKYDLIPVDRTSYTGPLDSETDSYDTAFYGVEATNTGKSVLDETLDFKEQNAIKYGVKDGIRTAVKQINQDGTLLLTLDRSTLSNPDDKRFPDELTFKFAGVTEDEAASYNEYNVYKTEQVKVGDTLWIELSSYYNDMTKSNLIKDENGIFSRIESKYAMRYDLIPVKK